MRTNWKNVISSFIQIIFINKYDKQIEKNAICSRSFKKK